MRRLFRYAKFALVFTLVLGFAGCICMRDPNNQSTFQFDENTGFYVFLDCSTETELVGQGKVTQRGQTYTLTDVQSDRRVLAIVDMSQKKGTASVQLFSPFNHTFSISARNVVQGAQVTCDPACIDGDMARKAKQGN